MTQIDRLWKTFMGQPFEGQLLWVWVADNLTHEQATQLHDAFMKLAPLLYQKPERWPVPEAEQRVLADARRRLNTERRI